MTLENAARAYTAQGDLSHALEYQTRANRLREKNDALNLAVGSERDKLQYAEAIRESIDRTISLHARVSPDSPAAAAEATLVLLQRKGQILDAMSGSLSALRQRMNADDRALLDQLGTATAALAALVLSGPGRTPLDAYTQQLAALESRRDALEIEIGGRSAEFRAQSLPVTVASVQQAIPGDAALIELAVYHPYNARARIDAEAWGPPHYIAYVLRPAGSQGEPVRWVELGPAADIDAAVIAMRRALRDPKRTDLPGLAREVDAKVLQPIRAIVGNATHLLISPDGELNLMPFEALVDEQGRYAVERFSISYLTSGRDLLRMQVARPGTHDPLIVSNPLFGATQVKAKIFFAPLPGTAEEAQTIKSLFPASAVLSGTHATKAALARADAPGILHIATHGFFLDDVHHVDNPLLRAGLALTGANLAKTGSEQGILTALEASTLNLWGTRLVTLSACDTGLGDVRNGEGVYGLRRAFVLAGAETIVMSLWPVSDYVTREMMRRYYRGLKQGLGRGEALRQAQLAMLAQRERRHPFYWASFIQAGDWRPFAADSSD